MTALNKQIAIQLREAYQQGVVSPIRDVLLEAGGDLSTAYDIQDINTQYWVSEGRRIVGRKIGLTSKAVQQQLGVDTPDMGVLFADMAVPSGESVDISSMLQPKIEAEVALVLATDLDHSVSTAADIISAVDYVLPAIEIVDSRVEKWNIKVWDTVADNASSAGYVLGNSPAKLEGLDLAMCGMSIRGGGELLSSGAGIACLGHPLNAALWLANYMSLRGTPLKAGDVVLTGALGPMVTAEAGKRYEARINGLGSVRVSFRGDE